MGGCFSSDVAGAGKALNAASGRDQQQHTQEALDMLTGMHECTSRIEVRLACSKLADKDITSKSDPFCVLFEQDPQSKQWTERGRTEVVVNNLSACSSASSHEVSVGVR